MSKMRKEYLPYLFKSFFITLPSAVVRKDPGWRWFVADIFRTIFVYETMMQVPIVYLSDLYSEIDKHSIVIPTPRASLKATEIISLASLVAHLKPRTIFEFCTHIGGRTLLLAMNAPEATVYTLNLPSEDDRTSSEMKGNIGIAFKEIECERHIIQIFGDSAKFNYDPFAGQIDFIFVDTAHDYESAKSDTENALRMLSPNGIIVWHDFPSSLGVRRFMLEFAKSHNIFQIYGCRFALYDPRIREAKIHQYWGWE